MRLLVGVATFPEEPICFPGVQEALQEAIQTARLALPELECVVRFYTRDEMSLEPNDRILSKHVQMRQDALDEEFDALWLVEADILMPPNALVDLIAVEADVAYALYVSRLSHMLLAFPKIDKFTGASLGADVPKAKEIWGTVVDSEGVGFGCTLIKQDVLKTVKFRRANKKFADDWSFAVDVKEAGFKSKHHLGVMCGHITRVNSVLWPDVNSPQLFREDFNEIKSLEKDTTPIVSLVLRQVYLGGESRYYYPDERITLNPEVTELLLARGFIKRIEG